MQRSTKLVIRELVPDDERQAIAAHHDLLDDDFDFLPTWSARQNWEAYIERMAEGRSGEFVPEGWVRSGLFVADLDGQLVGRVSVRYELNDFLSEVGGHLGYGVVPKFRGQGIATQLCRFALAELGSHGVDSALVTCDKQNAASRATIIACGGQIDQNRPSVEENGGNTKLRYWISTRG
ncbi:GNAT family N-acetyltransferase [Glutamicibacter sp. AOP12-B1-11]|uniref:GNAT family N-acetyltransferase n=1 Tax=Glutamicibacter sp. AOP12-B1-11 TaxID=3457725 RepID=UPI0040333E9D